SSSTDMARSGGGSLVGLRVVVVLVAFTLTLKPTAESLNQFMEGPVPIEFIIGGNPTSPTALPWQAFIQIKRTNGDWNCGGSLLKMKWILSAAHCFVQTKSTPAGVPNGYEITTTRMFIHVGVQDTNKLGSPVQSQVITENIGSHLRIHSQFNRNADLNNDIALIELAKEFILHPNVIPITLGTGSDAEPGKYLRASGFGRTVPSGTPTNILQSVSGLRLFNSSECEEYFQPLRYTFTDSMLCTINYKKGACQGDSGGAVITGEKGKSDGPPWVQIGIVSWGLPTCEDSNTGLVPLVVVNIQKFRQYIYEIIDVAEAPPLPSGPPTPTPPDPHWCSFVDASTKCSTLRVALECQQLCTG
ncbi:unnamed protein product, partial [Meganyctiphanes norvegica]